jgi:hypothetical protein
MSDASEEREGPKIIVDSDWKTEAASEKAKIDAETRESESHNEIPDPNLPELINMIAMQAIISLGGMQAPTGEPIPQDLPVAKHYIDLLALLEEKTKGNVSDDEARIFAGVLHELRMRFVECADASGPGAPSQPPIAP